MAYDKEELEKIALKVLEKEKLTTIEQVVSFMPCSSSTFYNHELEKLESIKEHLFKNREQRKIKIVKKMEDGDSVAGLAFAFKLLATEDELRRVNPPKQKEEEETEKPKPLVEWTEEKNENE